MDSPLFISALAVVPLALLVIVMMQGTRRVSGLTAVERSQRSEPAEPTRRLDSQPMPRKVISVPPMLPPMHLMRVLSPDAIVDVLAHVPGDHLVLSWQTRWDDDIPEALFPWLVQLEHSEFGTRPKGRATYTVALDATSIPLVVGHASRESEKWFALSLGTPDDLLAFVDFESNVAVLSATVYYTEFVELRRCGAVAAETLLLSHGLDEPIE